MGSNISRGFLDVLGFLTLGATGFAQTPPVPPPLALVHATIVDIVDARLLPDMTLVIQADRISAIGRSAELAVPKGVRTINARDKFVIPGLWDMHVHLSWASESALPLLVANGVTGVRDMGSRLTQIDQWRFQIAAGLRTGPRIIRVGPMVNGQKFNQYQMVAGNPDETRGVVRGLKEAGVDFIKIHRRLPRDSYFALMDEAKKQGIRVVGHVPLGVQPGEASDAGQASIEHAETLFESTVTGGELLDLTAGSMRAYLAEYGPPLFAKFVANHTVFTPTLAAWKAEIKAHDGSAPDPNLRYAAASLRRIPVQPLPVPLDDLFGGLCEAVRQMHAAGVTLMAGTDVSAPPRIPGFLLHEELAALVECGLTPIDALRAATVVPAAFLGRLDDFGPVQAGRMADLVLLKGNPLENIRNTREVWGVVAGGRLFQGAELGGLFREAERLASKN